jgi:hypothetical protein
MQLTAYNEDFYRANSELTYAAIGAQHLLRYPILLWQEAEL